MQCVVCASVTAWHTTCKTFRAEQEEHVLRQYSEIKQVFLCEWEEEVDLLRLWTKTNSRMVVRFFLWSKKKTTTNLQQMLEWGSLQAAALKFLQKNVSILPCKYAKEAAHVPFWFSSYSSSSSSSLSRFLFFFCDAFGNAANVFSQLFVPLFFEPNWGSSETSAGLYIFCFPGLSFSSKVQIILFFHLLIWAEPSRTGPAELSSGDPQGCGRDGALKALSRSRLTLTESLVG